MAITKKVKIYLKIKLIIIALLIITSCRNTKLSLRNINHEREKGKKEIVDPNKKVIVGLSSFYADKYHGRLTANGEVYDMHKMTCAHKSLPFNTKLKVTYLKTNKSVIVRVNDRGPFVKGRILDLSLGAAKEIGLFEDGVGEVRIEIL